MKNLYFLVLLFTFYNVAAQNWKFRSGRSDFDGKYKTSYVTGKGTDFPYNDPQIVINRFEIRKALIFIFLVLDTSKMKKIPLSNLYLIASLV